MIFVVLSVYVMYILYLNSSGTNIKKRKSTVQSQQKVKMIMVCFSGSVLFSNYMSSKD